VTKRNEIEVFGQCDMCEQERDLTPWKPGISLCQGCTWYADLHVVHIRGKHKINSVRAFELMKEMFMKKQQEVKNG
jgi:hypothetical protein